MIQWIFLDLGNVLFVDERDYLFRRYAALHDWASRRGLPISFEGLMRRREELVNDSQDPLPIKTLAEEILGVEGWRDVDRVARERQPKGWIGRNILVPGAPAVLEELGRHSRLGLAANQGTDCRAALHELDLLKHFGVIGISVERGVKKLSRRFFEALLAEAGCAPEQAVMVGDRFDNDIVPAKRLGMKAVWVELDFESHGWVPAGERERAYLGSLRRAPPRGRGRCADGIEPEARIRSLHQLPDAIQRLGAD